ncbi:helix-turn-helix domain-containing protein [Asticcacaulis sp. W401b]|uniref:helix-turn-helix domain-containing protein n=1 Tax=Asticcacaulis sp. W401b TaxID=3388666 RepID=UPI0039707DF6
MTWLRGVNHRLFGEVLPRRHAALATAASDCVAGIVGSNIGRVRKEREITRRQLADQIRCDLDDLGAIEEGHKEASAIQIYRAASTLGVTIASLFELPEDFEALP